MRANAIMPVGAEEYATAVMAASSTAVPSGAPDKGILDCPAPRMAARKNAAVMARPE